MKYALLIFLIMMVESCNPPKHITKEVNLSEIIDAPGMSSNEIYVEINSWMAEYFRSRESVIQFQDKEDGKVIGRFLHEFGLDNERYFVLDFDIKDNAFRLTMKGVVSSYDRDGAESSYFDPERNPYYRANPDEYPLSIALFDAIIAGIVDYMNEDNNW